MREDIRFSMTRGVGSLIGSAIGKAKASEDYTFFSKW